MSTENRTNHDNLAAARRQKQEERPGCRGPGSTRGGGCVLCACTRVFCMLLVRVHACVRPLTDPQALHVLAAVNDAIMNIEHSSLFEIQISFTYKQIRYRYRMKRLSIHKNQLHSMH